MKEWSGSGVIVWDVIVEGLVKWWCGSDVVVWWGCSRSGEGVAKKWCGNDVLV